MMSHACWPNFSKSGDVPTDSESSRHGWAKTSAMSCHGLDAASAISCHCRCKSAKLGRPDRSDIRTSYRHLTLARAGVTIHLPNIEAVMTGSYRRGGPDGRQGPVRCGGG